MPEAGGGTGGEVRARTLEYLRRETGEGDVGALGGIPGTVDEALGEEPVRTEEHDLIRAHQRAHVLNDLGGVVLDRRGAIEEVRSRVGDRGHQRLIFWCRRFVPLETKDFP